MNPSKSLHKLATLLFSALCSLNAAAATDEPGTPGIALSEQQMASLTSDIVWLERQTVTLADGSTTEALVPRVYRLSR